MTNANKGSSVTISAVVGFFLAIAPILDPYVLFTIGEGITLKVNDILMLIIGGFCFLKYHSLKSQTNFLIILICELFLVSYIANTYSSTDVSLSLKNIVIYLIYGIILSYIWKTPCREKFFLVIECVAMAASVVVFLQFIAGYLRFPMWDGQITFFNLGKYDGWSGYIDKNTGDIRPNGIFQEASYIGIYLSVALAHSLKRQKLKRALIFSLAMFATTSIISVASCIFVFLYSYLCANGLKITGKTRKRILIALIFGVVLMVFLANTYKSVGDSFDYIFKRLDNVQSDLNGTRMSSTKYRLLGHIDLFAKYDFVQRMVGVGVAQYAPYFRVTSYSNVWVTTLLNSGIIGLSFLIGTLVSVKRKTLTQNAVYFWLLILIFSADYQWFNWYFFYLFSACLLKEEKSLTGVGKGAAEI